MDERIQRWANLLVKYSTGVKKGEKVKVSGMPVSHSLLKALCVEIIKAGAFPKVDISLPEMQEIILKYGSKEQRMFLNPILLEEIKQYDVFISVWSEENTKALSGANPTHQQEMRAAIRPYFDLFLEKMGNGQIRWCGTEFPTSAYAQEAEMSLDDYTDFVLRACKCHLKNPSAEWKKVKQKQDKFVDFLSPVKNIRLVNKDTDLKFTVAGRKWINCCGDQNMPDGEVFTGPIENSANGFIRYTFPVCQGGREIEDVRLTFKDGKVVKASAAKNEEYLLKMLDVDEGARYVGETAFGLNRDIQKFTKNILFDEKIGGTFHIAVGASLPESGGTNKSALHWDMICDMRDGGKIYADNKLIFKDGLFIIDELKDL